MRATAPSPEDIDRRFREAVALHQGGHVAAAAAVYEDLRRLVPPHAELLHLHGTALVQLGRAAEAIPVLEQSLALRPRHAPTLDVAGTAHLMTGNAHQAAGRYQDALDAYEKALACTPDKQEALAAQAVCFAALGQADKALTAARRCVAKYPAFLHAYVILSTLLAQQACFQEAESVIRNGLKSNPGSADAHHLLAKTLRRQGRNNEAEAAYRAAFGLGLRTPAILTECSEVLIDEAKADAADALLREALRQAPDLPAALTAQGRLEELRGDMARAVHFHDRALAHAPHDANALVNRGTAKRFAGDIAGALADFNRALASQPGYPPALASRGMTLLAEGRLHEGWADFRARLKARDGMGDLSAGTPWDGGPLDGKRILVWTEQGVGDEIMAASLIPDLVARAAHCTVVCSPRLASLFRRSFPEAAIATAPPQGPFDARLPLMDAAQRLRPTLGAFPTHAGYLKADSIHAHALRERYGRAGQKLVGLSWRSSAAGMVGFKSTDLMQWKAILQTPGVGFVCLQYGDVADDVRAAAAASGIDVRVDTTIDPLGDLDAYAAQVAAMDLVISVSNTAVHVAGAMNVPTWVMTPQGRGRHWYWFKDRTDSPWYPSVRIFGQSQPDRWDHTLDDIGAQLRQWACP